MRHNAADILHEAQEAVDKEDRTRLVEAAKDTIRKKQSRSLVRRMLDLLPYTVTRKTK